MVTYTISNIARINFLVVLQLLFQAAVYSFLQAAIEISSRGDGRDRDVNVSLQRRLLILLLFISLFSEPFLNITINSFWRGFGLMLTHLHLYNSLPFFFVYVLFRACEILFSIDINQKNSWHFKVSSPFFL